MSEDPTQAAESAEIAQSAVESEGSPAPWGDDFNPERAWNTITHLRGREKELESEAKQWKQFREDEEFRRQQLSELGYEFEEDDEDDDTDDELAAQPAHDPRVDQLIAERAQERYERDLGKFAGDRELSTQAKDWIQYTTSRSGNSPEALEKAVHAWVEYEDGLRESVKRERPKPPTPPSTPSPGRAGEEQFDRKSASAAQRAAQRRARIAAAYEADAS